MAYNSPEEYLAAVQKQIRWKRAQKVVLEELRQHIDDQVDTFISQGMNRQQAIQHAIVQMGDPVTVGLELDRIHRPKTDFGLLFFDHWADNYRDFILFLDEQFFVFGTKDHRILFGSRFGACPVFFGLYGAVSLS